MVIKLRSITQADILRYINKCLKVTQVNIGYELNKGNYDISKIINGHLPGIDVFKPDEIYDKFFRNFASKHQKEQSSELNKLRSFLSESQIDTSLFEPQNPNPTYEEFVKSMLYYGWNIVSPIALNPNSNQNYSDKHNLCSSFSYSAQFFIGREEELNNIDKCLLDNKVVFLSGIGGIGKSELAQKYAYKNKNKYSSVSFGIYNDSIVSFLCNDQIINISNFSKEKDESVVAYFDRKLTKLLSITSNSNLIIVDNFNNINDENLSKLLSLNCKFIFTTRCSKNQINYPTIEVKHLDSGNEIKELFFHHYEQKEKELDTECIEKLLKLVDYHTITVEILAKTMRNGDITPVEMLKKLQESGISGIDEETIDIHLTGTNISESALNCLRIIFDINNLSDLQKKLMNYLVLIPPQGVERSLFKKLCNLSNNNIINNLINLSWVKYDNVRVALHPVIAEVIGSNGTVTYENCRDFISAMEHHLSSFKELHYTDDAKRTEMVDIAKYCPLKVQQAPQEFFSFIKICLEILADSSDIASVEPVCNVLKGIADSNECNNETRVRIYHCLGLTYKSYTLYKSAIDYIKKSIDNIDNNCTIPKEDIAEIYRDLGNIYKRISDVPNAIKMYKKALEIRKEIYENNHCEIAKSLNNIGIAYTKNNQAETAIDYHEKALQIVELNPSENRALIAWTFNCLGLAELKLGNTDTSIEYHLKALDLYDLNNPNHYLAFTYWNLGEAYRKKQNFEKTIDYHNKALEIRKNIFGEESKEAAVSISQLADVYSDFYYYENALEFANQALKMRIKALGELSWDVAWSYYSIGDIYFKRKQYDLSLNNYQKSLNIRLSINNEISTATAYNYMRIGDIYNLQENNDLANEYYKKALEITKSLQLPTKHTLILDLDQKIKQLKSDDNSTNHN